MKLKATQLVAIDQACIQTDLEGKIEEDIFLGRVPKNDGVGKHVVVQDKFMSDPEKLLLRLLA